MPRHRTVRYNRAHQIAPADDLGELLAGDELFLDGDKIGTVVSVSAENPDSVVLITPKAEEFSRVTQLRFISP
jgi:hypothetical protein